MINSALYRWALDGDINEAQIIEKSTDKVIGLYSLFKNGRPLLQYSAHISTVLQEQATTQRLIEKALGISTQTTIERIESQYLAHYFSIIEQSKKKLYFIFVYAVLVLAIAIYLSVMLKRSYSRLKARDEYRSQQINVAYKHLGYADDNVDVMKQAFTHIKITLAYINGIFAEAKKDDKDTQKIKLLLTQALKKYSFLDKNNTVTETDKLLDKSNKNIDRATELVKELMVE